MPLQLHALVAATLFSAACLDGAATTLSDGGPGAGQAKGGGSGELDGSSAGNAGGSGLDGDGGSVGSSSAGGTTGDAGLGGGGSPLGGLFSQPMPWTKDVAALPKSVESDTIIAGLTAAGGWGVPTFRTDISITVQRAVAGTPLRTFTPTSEFYSPDCDQVALPVPIGGALEGENGYSCTNDGDCHLIVIDPIANKLFEMWRANIGASFSGGCAVVWDLAHAYDPGVLRGKGCTSADAAGLPIAAHLATSDEVVSGEVRHALRFILPNSRIQAGMFVAPATHTTAPTSGGANLPPYGVRFRLKASFDETSLASQGARVLARALKRYGMFLSDGGNIPLTVADDRFMQHKWSEVGFSSTSLDALKVSDFEVVDMGPRANGKNIDCTRAP